MKKVAFILAPGHSGSTLLGDVLGTNSHALHVGEIISPLNKGKPIRCLYCDDQPCPIWNEALTPPFVQRCYASFQRDMVRHPLRRLARRLQQPRLAREQPGALFVRLFEQRPSLDCIVDSSKNVRWALWNQKRSTLDCRFIFLFRDVRALVASRVRNRSEPIAQATAAVSKSLATLLAFQRANPDSFQIQYEQFVGEPQPSVVALCHFLQLPYEEQMLQYYRQPRHIFGGNAAGALEARRYQGRPTEQFAKERNLPQSYTASSFYQSFGFRLDERWKHELSSEQQSDILRLAADVNSQMGYENRLH